MSLSFTDAAMTYLGQQIGANNKVPAGQSFLIAIAIMEAEGDDALFLIKGTYSNGAVSNLDKTFAQITAASGNDKVIVMKLTEGSSYYYLPCSKITSSSIVFADDIESGLKVTISSADAVTVGTATAAVSWNDLTDRPFYETVTAAGYNFEIDLDDPNYVSGHADIGVDVPAKFYRVGNPLTAAQLLGAMGTVNANGENNYHVIESNYIEEITDNGDTVGLFVTGDMPYCLVINNANTTIDIDATNDRPFGLSGTFASAGTYLYWIDLSTMGEGASAYAVSLVKEPEATITPLPDKYYKAPLIVEITGSNQTGYESNKTFNEIVAAVQAGRNIIAYIETNNGYFVGYPSGFAASDFGITAEAYNNGYKLGVSIQIDSSDGITANYYSINANTI